MSIMKWALTSLLSALSHICPHGELQTYFPARLGLGLQSPNNCQLRSTLPSQTERRKETVTAGQVVAQCLCLSDFISHIRGPGVSLLLREYAEFKNYGNKNCQFHVSTEREGGITWGVTGYDWEENFDWGEIKPKMIQKINQFVFILCWEKTLSKPDVRCVLMRNEKYPHMHRSEYGWVVSTI